MNLDCEKTLTALLLDQVRSKTLPLRNLGPFKAGSPLFSQSLPTLLPILSSVHPP